MAMRSGWVGIVSNDAIRSIAAALARFDSVVDWLGIGGGKMQGPEYLSLNPLRSDAKPGSFTINRTSSSFQ
jgi:putative DNA primase/helicase